MLGAATGGENCRRYRPRHWVDHAESLWLGSFGDNTGVLEREPTEAGGEFALTFQSEKYQEDRIEPIGIKTRIRRSKPLRVRSEHGIHLGELKSDCGEMSFDLVILPNGTPQEIADRVAPRPTAGSSRSTCRMIIRRWRRRVNPACSAADRSPIRCRRSSASVRPAAPSLASRTHANAPIASSLCGTK